MNLRSTRMHFRPDGIFSGIFLDDGNDFPTMFMVTLEHAYKRSDPAVSGSLASYPEREFIPKIITGDFACRRGKHRLHGMKEDFETFEVTGIPGHLNLLFHWGNFNENSEGCILTGERLVDTVRNAKPTDMITNSRTAFDRFMKLQEGLEEFRLKVES
jgi:hypothetical protein